MKLKRRINKVLKEMYGGEITISKKSILLIEEYLFKFLRYIKEDITFYDKLYKNKNLWRKSRERYTVKSPLHGVRDALRLQEIFDGDTKCLPHSDTKIKIFKLKQILLGILPLYILQNSVEYANNILAIYLRHREKESLMALNDTPRSRSYDDILEGKKPIFNPNKIRKYFKENNIKLMEKSYIFLAAVMEWLIQYIFLKIMEARRLNVFPNRKDDCLIETVGENTLLEKINYEECEKIINSLDFKSF